MSRIKRQLSEHQMQIKEHHPSGLDNNKTKTTLDIICNHFMGDDMLTCIILVTQKGTSQFTPVVHNRGAVRLCQGCLQLSPLFDL